MLLQLTLYAASNFAVVSAVGGLLAVYGGCLTAGPVVIVPALVRNRQLDGVGGVHFNAVNNPFHAVFNQRKVSTVLSGLLK